MDINSIFRLAFVFIYSTLYLNGVSQENMAPYLQQLSEKEKIDTLINLAEFYVETNPDTSIFFANKATIIAQDQDDQRSISRISKLLADAYFYKDDLGEAIHYYKYASNIDANIYGKTSDEYGVGQDNIGYCFYILGMYDVAVEYYESSLEIARNNDNMGSFFTSLNNIGTVYFAWGQYDKAVDAYDQTLKYDIKTKNLDHLSSSYNNIGKIYYTWGKYEKAIEYYSQSLEYAKQVEDSNKMAIRYGNLGMVYFKLDEQDLARNYLDKAKEIDEKRGNIIKVAIRNNNIGKLLSTKGDFLNAKEYHIKALEAFDQFNILESKAIVLNDLGKTYLQLNNFDKAEQSFVQAIAISRETGTAQVEMNAHFNLSALYEKTEKYDNALSEYKLYETLKATMFTQESSKQLSAFEVKYETEKKEIENQLLKQENETKSRNQWILITLVSVLLVLTILLIYFVRLRTKSHKQQKALNEIELSKTEQEKQHLEDKVFAEKQINRLQKDKYSSELEHKSSQLANSTLSLINKNEVLRKLKSEIVAVNGNGSDFSEILNIINQNLDLDIDWNKFKVEFEEAHPQFFERLYKAYPNLSETYIKICAYIRIDLTSREIADLLHVSQAAVNKNRQRMRKMLALEAEADLGLFLKEL